MDVPPEEFRAAAHAAADWVAGYLANPGDYPVLSRVRPGEILARIPGSMPLQGEPLADLLRDFEDVVLPGITHWNHPRFFAYFGTTASAPGILAELLIAALNVNAMLWRTSPAATEIEQAACRWLARAMGLPEAMIGTINDTASSSTLYALTAAREAIPGLEARRLGVDGRRLRYYCSAQAHSSVEKAGIVLGTGQAGCVRVPVDPDFRMDVAELERAITSDRAAGLTPFAVVATVGTTSTTSIDPVPAIAAACEREGLWLHVDAAYGGSAAVVPELAAVLEGCERADSLVVNPHKWLFTPSDCSVLYCRRDDVLRQAFSLVPDYLTTAEGEGVRNLMDYGTSLGRRFRGLKLWFVLRALGLDGAREAIRGHVAMARELRGWVEAEPGFEVLAPTPFSTVCFRFEGPDEVNQRIIDEVNRSGIAFLSHTRLHGRLAIRVAIGNLRTTPEDVRITWELIRDAARAAAGRGQASDLSQTSISKATP